MRTVTPNLSSPPPVQNRHALSNLRYPIISIFAADVDRISNASRKALPVMFRTDNIRYVLGASIRRFSWVDL